MMEFLPSPQRRIFFYPFLFSVAVILGSCMTPVTGTGSVPPRPTPRPETTPSARAICQTKQLLLTEGRSGAAGGHVATLFSFENHSRETCMLFGYPALQQVDAQHKPLTEPIQQATSAYTYRTQGLQAITLHPGEKAYFVIEWTDVCASPPASFLLITPPGNQAAFLVDLRHASASPPASFLLITPPGNQTSLQVARRVPACEDTVTVSPLVPSCRALESVRCDQTL